MKSRPAVQPSSRPAVQYQGRTIDMMAARILMDDEICSQIHGSVDNDQEFMDAYAKEHKQKYGTEFVFN